MYPATTICQFYCTIFLFFCQYPKTVGSLPLRFAFCETPLPAKNFFRFVKAKPDNLSVFSAGTLSRLKRRALQTGSLSFCGTLSHTLPRSVFEKTPLGTLKNFFKCVKAKPDGLWAFRAGTSSRLKRRALSDRLSHSLWDAVPHPAMGAFLKKRPLEPSKTFLGS